MKYYLIVMMLPFIEATLITFLPNLFLQSLKRSGPLDIYCQALKWSINAPHSTSIRNADSVRTSIQRAGGNTKMRRGKKEVLLSEVKVSQAGGGGDAFGTGRSTTVSKPRLTLKFL